MPMVRVSNGGTDEYDEGVLQALSGSSACWVSCSNGGMNGVMGTGFTFTGNHLQAYVSGKITYWVAITAGNFRVTNSSTGTTSLVYKEANETIHTANWGSSSTRQIESVMYCVKDNQST